MKVAVSPSLIAEAAALTEATGTASDGAASTTVCTTSICDGSPEASMTTRANVRTTLAVSAVGAVKVGVTVSAPCSMTGGTPTWLQT